VCDRGDEPDLAAAVLIAPTLSHLAAIARIDRNNGQFPIDRLHQFARGHYVLHLPAIGSAHIHKLDKAERAAGLLEVAGHGQHAVLVHAALDYHVDLDRRQPNRGCLLDALEYFAHREVDVVHGPEHGVVERIQTDRNAVEPGIF